MNFAIIFCVLATATYIQAIPNQFTNLRFNGRIVGGNEAKIHQFPYQVGLNIFLENGRVSFCGGSLISEEYILTAAHCTDGVRKIEVVMGAHKVDDPTEATQVRMNTSIIIPHERWYPTMLLNDIALVKLPHRVKFNKFINAIKLPTEDVSSFDGNNAVVSGWGKDSDDSNVISPVLRFVETDIISGEACLQRYPKVIHDTHLCTSGSDGKSSCNGDSGGPLVIDHLGTHRLIGIVSFGWKTCQTNHPAVFTRVTKYLEWINKNAEFPK